jgi:hypothetical protein
LSTKSYASLRVDHPSGLKLLLVAALFFALCLTTAGVAKAQEGSATLVNAFNGRWVLNEELSDDTDKQVERAIKKGGGKVRRGKKEKGRYRGGPETQKLYDHISYDEVLEFSYEEPRFTLRYEQGFERVFYSDGRKQVISAFGGGETPADYSFAGWEGNALYVESKPLDAGYILETYTLLGDGAQLRLEAVLEPSTFVAPIKLVRVFDRQAVSSPANPKKS